MQTQIEETTEERILIYTNETEVGRITAEIETRRSLLNKILDHGVGKDELQNATVSTFAIEDYVFQKQLKMNKVLMEQFKAGKKNLKNEYVLPQNLQTLKDLLQAFNSYPGGRHADKFQHLMFDDTWKIDVNQLESHFIRTSNKVYVQGQMLAEWRQVKQLCEILMNGDFPPNDLKNSQWLNNRIQSVGRNVLEPRWSWFIESNRGRY